MKISETRPLYLFKLVAEDTYLEGGHLSAQQISELVEKMGSHSFPYLFLDWEKNTIILSMILKKIVPIIIIGLFSNFAKSEERIIWKSKTPVGEIGKIIAKNGNIYLSDLSQVKILIFNEKGDLKGSVGKRGEGPGEIKRIDDFDLWNNEIFIKESGFRIKRFNKEGNEIESLELSKFGIYFNKFFVLGKDKFLLIGIDTSESPMEVEKNDYNIFHIVDLKRTKKESFGFPLKGMKNKKYPLHIILLGEMNFFRFNNNLYFYDLFKYKIFKINLDKKFQEEIIDEEVPYFQSIAGDIEVYQTDASTTVATNLRFPKLQIFFEGEVFIVALKTKGRLWLREYHVVNNKYYFREEKELKGIEDVYCYKKGIFFGIDKNFDLVAFKL